jgi:hypothetical protein
MNTKRTPHIDEFKKGFMYEEKLNDKWFTRVVGRELDKSIEEKLEQGLIRTAMPPQKSKVISMVESQTERMFNNANEILDQDYHTSDDKKMNWIRAMRQEAAMFYLNFHREIPVTYDDLEDYGFKKIEPSSKEEKLAFQKFGLSVFKLDDNNKMTPQHNAITLRYLQHQKIMVIVVDRVYTDQVKGREVRKETVYQGVVLNRFHLNIVLSSLQIINPQYL